MIDVYMEIGERRGSYAFADAAIALQDLLWVACVYHGSVHGDGDFAAVAATGLDFAVFAFSFWQWAAVRMGLIGRAQSLAVETSNREQRDSVQHAGERSSRSFLKMPCIKVLQDMGLSSSVPVSAHYQGDQLALMEIPVVFRSLARTPVPQLPQNLCSIFLAPKV